MKRFAITLCALIMTFMTGFAQKADKPELMVIPSDNWFFSNGYYTIVNTNGKEKKVPDWERAFTENADINNVITTIAQMFINRGFTVTNAWDEMKTLEEEMAEEMALEADGEGDATMTSAFDQVVNQVKPDIKLEINWQTNKLGLSKNVIINIDGKDTYTNQMIAPMQRQSDDMPSGTLLTVMLKQAVEGGFEQLSDNLMTYFEHLSTQGREIRLAIRITQKSPVNLNSMINGKRLRVILQEWVRENTINNSGQMKASNSPLRANFNGIRIPLQNKDGVKMDASEWAVEKGLEKYLNSLKVPARVDSKGLGSIVVRIGAE